MTLSLPQAFGLACKMAGPLRIRATHRNKGSHHDYVINSPFTFIGRSAAAGVRLDDPSVSQGHAYLQLIEGAPYCIDLGSRTGVIWDDGTQGDGWVGIDQTLQIGTYDVRIEGAAEPPRLNAGDDLNDSDQDPGPSLTPAVVEVQPTVNTPVVVHPLDRPITLVGRHPSCDLRLLDVTISYFQAALVNTADGVWLVDAMTRKGAILNGRGTRLARVRDGDLLELGKVSIVLRIGAHHDSRLALRTPSTPPSTLDPVAAITTAVAESLAGAFVPVGDMMKQFQQCYMAMAQMFATMQQEHATLVSEQMRQIQDLAEELRELRAGTNHSAPSPIAIPATSPLPPSEGRPTPPAARVPNLNNPTVPEHQSLSDAHAWFMARLANKGQSPPTSP